MLPLATIELLEHESGFRAVVPIEKGWVARLHGMKTRRSTMLDVVLGIAILLPCFLLLNVVGFFVGVLPYLLVRFLLLRGMEAEPVRIVDLDRGRVRVADSHGTILFSAPLEEVVVGRAGGLTLESDSSSIHVQTDLGMGDIAERLIRAKAAHGSHREVPDQMRQLREQ